LKTTLYNFNENNTAAFSIVIPTKNRPQALIDFLESLEKQSLQDSYSNFAVIIVDQSDAAMDKVFDDRFKTIPIIYCYDPSLDGGNAARIVGLKYASGKYTFIFDDDIVLTDNSLSDIMMKMDKFPEIMAMCFALKTNKTPSRLKKFITSLTKTGVFRVNRNDLPKELVSKYKKDRIVATYKLSGGACCYRSELFKEFSFSDELYSYCLGDDYDLSYRISKKYIVTRCYSLVIIHNHNQVGRFNHRKYCDSLICFYRWFYDKNIKKTFKNKLAYRLLIFGVWINALVNSCLTLSLAPFKGILDGNKKIKNNYIGAYCIKSKEVLK
jgi:GT2 family glycosyltransferase